MIWGHVNTTWSRNDAQFLDSEANAAMNEMMGMIASLRIGTPAFKSDGTPATNKTFGAEEAKMTYMYNMYILQYYMCNFRSNMPKICP